MRIHPVSDLHIDFEEYEFPEDLDSPDVVIMAGDTAEGLRGFKWALTLPYKVIYILGNHENYSHDRFELIKDMRLMSVGTNVTFMENDEYCVEGVRFLAATLFTDYEYGATTVVNMMNAQREMSDFYYSKYKGKKIIPQNYLDWHNESKRFLNDRLDAKFDGPTIVISHHGPTPKCLEAFGRPDKLSASYASEKLDNVIAKANLWIFGHTHTSSDFMLGDCRVLSNARGYYGENQDFNSHLIIDTNDILHNV